jgi:hypothetical protein
METHAHHLHNVPGKNFWHYFFEFFMLFLAVFCGFMAENYREHKIEHERTNELAKSFYEELKSDSVTAVIKVNNRLKQEKALTYLIQYFNDSNLNAVSKTFAINYEYGINFRTPGVFEPKTTILEQLKNSGSLRYFKNDELQTLIGDLTVAIRNITDRQALETTFRMGYLNPLLIKNHDYNFWTSLTDYSTIPFDVAMNNYEKSDSIIPFHLRGINKIDREETAGILSFYSYNALSSTRQVHIKKYITLNAELLKVLRKEYNLQ